MHWSGLFNTTEINQKAAAYSSDALAASINHYVSLIKQVQEFNPTQRAIDFRHVVSLDVERFFRLQLGVAPYNYVFTHSTTGQPAGMTLLTRISW